LNVSFVEALQTPFSDILVSNEGECGAYQKRFSTTRQRTIWSDIEGKCLRGRSTVKFFVFENISVIIIKTGKYFTEKWNVLFRKSLRHCFILERISYFNPIPDDLYGV
jgi:hypothetical protein